MQLAHHTPLKVGVGVVTDSVAMHHIRTVGLPPAPQFPAHFMDQAACWNAGVHERTEQSHAVCGARPNTARQELASSQYTSTSAGGESSTSAPRRLSSAHAPCVFTPTCALVMTPYAARPQSSNDAQSLKKVLNLMKKGNVSYRHFTVMVESNVEQAMHVGIPFLPPLTSSYPTPAEPSAPPPPTRSAVLQGLWCTALTLPRVVCSDCGVDNRCY